MPREVTAVGKGWLGGGRQGGIGRRAWPLLVLGRCVRAVVRVRIRILWLSGLAYGRTFVVWLIHSHSPFPFPSLLLVSPLLSSLTSPPPRSPHLFLSLVKTKTSHRTYISEIIHANRLEKSMVKMAQRRPPHTSHPQQTAVGRRGGEGGGRVAKREVERGKDIIEGGVRSLFILLLLLLLFVLWPLDLMDWPICNIATWREILTWSFWPRKWKRLRERGTTYSAGCIERGYACERMCMERVRQRCRRGCDFDRVYGRGTTAQGVWKGHNCSRVYGRGTTTVWKGGERACVHWGGEDGRG